MSLIDSTTLRCFVYIHVAGKAQNATPVFQHSDVIEKQTIRLNYLEILGQKRIKNLSLVAKYGSVEPLQNSFAHLDFPNNMFVKFGVGIIMSLFPTLFSLCFLSAVF